MSELTLSPSQKKVARALWEWLKTDSKSSGYITMGGYAGTGKTTLISILSKALHKQNQKLRIAFVSFTGKASQVLGTKLEILQAKGEKDFVGTIHSLIYSPKVNDKEQIVGWDRKEKIGYDLLVVDEASMVLQSLWRDLRAFNIPIIAVGDHGQLPPVEGQFNLMKEPELRLEEIHRQALDNPIIALAQQVRASGEIPLKRFGRGVIKFDRSDPDTGDFVQSQLQQSQEDTLLLCGYNSTRIKLNTMVRNYLGFESAFPESGDRVICLRNNHKKNVFNGMLGKVSSISSEDEVWYRAEIAVDDRRQLYSGLIAKDQFNSAQALQYGDERAKYNAGDLFDFGYALTVHKAQGSQARKVILFEERFKQMSDEDWRRWLYTAVTRAEEELYIIGE